MSNPQNRAWGLSNRHWRSTGHTVEVTLDPALPAEAHFVI